MTPFFLFCFCNLIDTNKINIHNKSLKYHSKSYLTYKNSSYDFKFSQYKLNQTSKNVFTLLSSIWKKVLTLFRDTSCFVFSHYCLFFFFSCVNNVKQSCPLIAMQIYLPWDNSYRIVKSLVDSFTIVSPRCISYSFKNCLKSSMYPIHHFGNS